METKYIIQLRYFTRPTYLFDYSDIDTLEDLRDQQLSEAKENLLKNPEQVKNYLRTIYNLIWVEKDQIYNIYQRTTSKPLTEQNDNENLFWHDVLVSTDDAQAEILEILISIFPELLNDPTTKSEFEHHIPVYNVIRQQAEKVTKPTVKPEKDQLTAAQVGLFFHYLAEGKHIQRPEAKDFRIEEIHKKPPYYFNLSGNTVYKYFIHPELEPRNFAVVIPMLEKYEVGKKLAQNDEYSKNIE